jgi:hypothetical protein
VKDFFKKLTGGSGKGKKKKRRRRRSGDEKKRRDEPEDPNKESTRRLQRKLEDNAQTMSIRRLQKYGLQSVRVIDANSIRDLVNTAVDEALRHRGADLSLGEREAVHDHAKAQIMELLEENQRLSQEKTAQERQLEEAQAEYSTQRTELHDQLDALRAELLNHQRELQAELAAARRSGGGPAPATSAGSGSGSGSSAGAAVEVMQQVVRKEISFTDEAFEDMEGRVRLLLEHLVKTGELGSGSDEELANLATSLQETLGRVIADVKEQETGQSTGRSEKVEMLELRIRKLNLALEEKEVALKKLAQHKGFVDNGLASIYDQIQGLDFEDPDFERKSELLKEVFDQNRELQEFMGNAVPESAEPATPPEEPLPTATPEAGSVTASGLQIPEGFAAPVELDLGGEMAF